MQTKPYAIHGRKEQLHQLYGFTISILANSEQTGGEFNLFKIQCPIDFTIPLHIHYAEDLAIYLLSGKVTFHLGNEKIATTAGDSFFLPKGTPFGLSGKSPVPVKVLLLTIPAGIDRLLLEPDRMKSSIDAMKAAAHHKIEFFGPVDEDERSED